MKSPAEWSVQELVYLTIIMCTLFCTEINSSAIQLQTHNLDTTLRSNELVFVNFYADWCRFSQMLQPIFDETAKKIHEEFPEQGRVVLGKVDCDKEGGIASKFHVSKYPTLKVFRYGTLVKREYRGQRSVESLSTFIRDALKDPINRITTIEELENLDVNEDSTEVVVRHQGHAHVKKVDVYEDDGGEDDNMYEDEDEEKKKRHIIGYFDTEDSQHFHNYKKLASMLRDECEFHAAIGRVSENERGSGNKIVYRQPNPEESDIPYTGDMNHFEMLHTWAMDKCVPLVREITFENAEELTEEGLPFLIMFHHPDDTETPDKYRKIVAKELLQEKNGVNFLTADGQKFSHPLYHLGKSTSDLPVLAIDSFRHMYLWKKDPKENLENGDELKQFIADLHSGKLHREFHHGPDKTPAPPGKVWKWILSWFEEAEKPSGANANHIPHESEEKKDPVPRPTTPPESTFKKLAPSRNRYTILRDEL